MDKPLQEKYLIEDIHTLGNMFGSLADRALAAYRPVVDQLIRSNGQDTQACCHILDGLFGFCFDDRVLLLYRKVCRHLYFQDPVAAVEYVNMYREYYEEDDNDHENHDRP